MFFGHALRRVPFFDEGGCGMDINFFKDILFDLLNESDAIDAADIQTDDKNNAFTVMVQDGTSFTVKVEKGE